MNPLRAKLIQRPIDYSPVLKSIIQKNQERASSFHKQNAIPRIIKSYELKNQCKLTSHLGDEMNRFLFQEIQQVNHGDNKYTLNLIDVNADDSDDNLKRLQKLHLIRFKPERLTKSKSTCSKLSVSSAQANYSHIIPETTLLPLLVSSPIKNNRLSQKKVKAIQSKIRENVQLNIEKLRRLYDSKYLMRIPDALNNHKSIKLIQMLKQKYSLSEINSSITVIEGKVSESERKAKRNRCDLEKARDLIKTRLKDLIREDQIGERGY